MTTRVTETRSSGARYVQRYVSADGRVHDFALSVLEPVGANVTYVPRCQENRDYPTARFFARELHDADEVGQEHRCPWCGAKARRR